MLSGNDEWLDQMPWVPPMPGNKTYVLEEAQKEIERLRKEIRRLRIENKELRAGMDATKERPITEDQQKSPEDRRKADGPNLKKGEYLFITGLVKILAYA